MSRYRGIDRQEERTGPRAADSAVPGFVGRVPQELGVAYSTGYRLLRGNWFLLRPADGVIRTRSALVWDGNKHAAKLNRVSRYSIPLALKGG
jgi:hypothetical protein